MPGKKSFSEYLAVLVDEDQELTARTLKAFSSLMPEQLEEFETAWGNTSPERKREAATALVGLAEEDVEQDFTGIFMRLLHDSDPEVRCSAIEGLWEDESRDLLQQLIPLIENDPSEAVREKATIGLSRFALLAELGKLPSRWVSAVYNSLRSQALNASNPISVQRRAVEGLGYYDEAEEVRDIITRSYRSDNLLMKASALVAMGRSVDTRWLPEIGRELSSEEPSLRYEAARAAGEVGSQELVTPLIGLTKDRDPEVRLAAIWALGQVGGPEAGKTLKALANSESETVREAVKEALAEINYAENPLNVLNS